MILLSDGDLQWYIRGYFSHIFIETPMTILRQKITSVQAIICCLMRIILLNLYSSILVRHVNILDMMQPGLPLHGSCKYLSVEVRFQMADISTGGHYTHGQRFLTNMTTVSEKRKTCPPHVGITHYLHYMAQIHARQTMTESTSELCWSLTPDCDNATVSCYET